MVDLKPCPFCGGKAKMVTYRIAEDAMGATVHCASCQACIAEFEDAYAPVDDAEDAWNRRADTDEITTLRARIAELEAERDGIRDKALEDAAKVADDGVKDFERQASTEHKPFAHDALLMCADVCELTATAIRQMRSKT